MHSPTQAILWKIYWRSRWGFAAAAALTGVLFVNIPKGFFPQQDTGRLTGSIQADQQTSFQAMESRFAQFAEAIKEDPDVTIAIGTVDEQEAKRTYDLLREMDQLGELDAPEFESPSRIPKGAPP